MRKGIALLINQLEGRYQTPLWWGAYEAAEERGYRLFVFPGKTLETPVFDDLQHNIIYKFIDPDRFDGFVLLSGVLANNIGKERYLTFIRPFLARPCVSVSVEIEGIPSIVIDNAAGMIEVTRHLIRDHGCGKIGFLGGPAENEEALLRYASFRRVLEEERVAWDDAWYFAGDFRPPSGTQAVTEMLDARRLRLDALVCANDDMCATAFTELQRRGLDIPGDIAITGFDDIEDMKYLRPSVTTVSQPLYEQGHMATYALIDLIEGRKPPSLITLPTNVVYRQSCGCRLSRSDRPGAGKRPQTSVEEGGEDASTVIARAAGVFPVSEERRKKITSGLFLIRGVFREGLQSGTIQEDQDRIIEELLLGDHHKPEELVHWQNALATVWNDTTAGVHDAEALARAEKVYHQCVALISEIIIRKEANAKIEQTQLFLNIRLFNQKMNAVFSMEELTGVVADTIPLFGIRHFFLVLYPSSFSVGRGMTWNLPELVALRMACLPEGLMEIPEEEHMFPLRQIVPPKLIPERQAGTSIVMPLFNIDEHFGYLVLEATRTDNILYESLREQISSTLKSIRLFEERRSAEKQLREILRDLENSNQVLHSITLRDELTGLHNRRGFLSLGKQHTELARKSGMTFLVIFIDMDGLKVINDTYGHKEGDRAIRATSGVLRQTFRSSDLISRIGGDEFTVIAKETGEKDIEILRGRLEHLTAEYNKKKEARWTLSLSLGFALYDGHAALEFDELIQIADSHLYEEKSTKRAR